jgi:ribose 1,5-bisphosphokinase PhnN
LTHVVVVTGPVGVGKTAVTREMTEVLDEREIPYLRYDADAVQYRPHPPDDRFGERATLQVLEYTWRLLRSSRVILPKVVETRDWIDRYRTVIPESEVTIVRLTAPRDVVAARVRGREIGAGLDWHLARAIELEEHWEANPVEDFTVENIGPVRDVALEVLRRVGWV